MAGKKKRGSGVNAKGRNTRDDRHVRLYHWLLNSDAWINLSPPAFKILAGIWKRNNGENNGRIPYSVRDAEAIGISKSTAARALQELQEKGFIRMTADSTFSLKTKEAREWELTAEPVGDNLPAKDFMRWRNLEHSPTSGTVQSHQRDSAQQNCSKTPSTVPSAGPSATNSPVSQSRQRDTYSLPRSGAE